MREATAAWGNSGARRPNIWRTQAAVDLTHDRHVCAQRRVLVHLMLIDTEFMMHMTEQCFIIKKSVKNICQHSTFKTSFIWEYAIKQSIKSETTKRFKHSLCSVVKQRNTKIFQCKGMQALFPEPRTLLVNTRTHTFTHMPNACRRQIIPADFHALCWGFSVGWRRRKGQQPRRESISGSLGSERASQGKVGINCLR